MLQRVKRGREVLLQLLAQKQIIIRFDLDAELVTIMALLSRYQSVPVSLADAELVRMSELYPNSLIFTLDSDFLFYRKNRDRRISLLMPPSSY